MKNYYPRGKLCNDDEGACIIAVLERDNTVIIDFGKELKWIGMDKSGAIRLAEMILERANSIKT